MKIKFEPSLLNKLTHRIWNKVHKTWKIIFFTLPCLALIGCQYDPHAHRLTTSEPSPTDIVGVYTLDQYYLPNEMSIQNKDIKVELNSDGTFTATNIPPWKFTEPDSNFLTELSSGEGKWEISEMGILDPGS